MWQRLAAVCVIEDGIDVSRRARTAGKRRDRGDRALTISPTKIKHRRRWICKMTSRDEVNRLSRIKADVAKVEVAGQTIETRTEWIANPQRDHAHAGARAGSARRR